MKTTAKTILPILITIGLAIPRLNADGLQPNPNWAAQHANMIVAWKELRTDQKGLALFSFKVEKYDTDNDKPHIWGHLQGYQYGIMVDGLGGGMMQDGTSAGLDPNNPPKVGDWVVVYGEYEGVSDAGDLIINPHQVWNKGYLGD